MAMIIGAVIIVSYTTMGGFLAVSTTDLVQSIFHDRCPGHHCFLRH